MMQTGTEWPGKNLHKVQCIIILQPFAAESLGLHQNAKKINWQREKVADFGHCD